MRCEAHRLRPEALLASGRPDDLIAEEGEAVTDGPGVKEADGPLVGGLTEEALARPEYDGVDHQAYPVDQVVFHQGAHELAAGVDDDFPVQLLLQLRDLVHHLALEDRRVVPAGCRESGGDDVFGQAVQPVRPLATPACPPGCEVLVAPPAQPQGPGAQRPAELGLGPRFAVFVPNLAEPAAVPEAFLTGRPGGPL